MAASAGIAATIFVVIGVRLLVAPGDEVEALRRHSPDAARSPRAWMPLAAAGLAALAGLANVISALTPELHGRLIALEGLAPSGLVVAAHAAVLPAGLSLLVMSAYLARGRRRALWLAVGLLVVLGLLDLLKGLDVEEATISWAVAGVLVWGRDAFEVRHEDGSIGTALARAGLTVAVVGTTALVGVLVAGLWSAPELTPGIALRETADLLMLGSGPEHYGEDFAWLPDSIRLLSLSALMVAAWCLFRPLCAPRGAPPTHERALAGRLVRRHGHDTLSAFKLRDDLQTLVSDDGRAFLSYRVEQGALLVAGDPVGAPDAFPGLLRRLRAFAAERGLVVGAVVASAGFAEQARDAGMKALYVGDEAIVSTTDFSLQGRAIRKVRQAVNRVERAGYTAQSRRVDTLAPGELAELEGVSDRWRAGAAEHGFSMAMDRLENEHVHDAIVLIARDGDGRARGFLHFVPAYGSPVMSLSSMRRDPDTPNGLGEYLVVKAIEELGAQGVGELSLNFAAFARWLHSPAGRIERLLARLLIRADRHFQVQSLYRFNAKFGPRWQSRYLLYESLPALPRTALAALWAEGQLPRPAPPRALRRLRALPA